MQLCRMLASLLVASLVVACSAARAPRRDWLSPVGREHPLVGTIWDIAARRSIDREALVARLAASEIVLLGDKHDNADHHRLQAEILAALVARGRRPAVAFEPISVDRRDALAGALAAGTPSAVIAAVSSAGSGWRWDLYEPVLATALDARLPVVAADLDPAWVRTIHARGLAGLDPAVVERLALGEPRLSAAARSQLADEIRRDHCGHAPDAMVDRMIDAQHARDAQLARALLDAVKAGADGAVLIAGAGHVRRDRAVPLDVARWTPEASVASVAFLEVLPDRTDAAAMLAQLGEPPPFDYVWFTPRVDLIDPCERFREQLQRLRASAPAP